MPGSGHVKVSVCVPLWVILSWSLEPDATRCSRRRRRGDDDEVEDLEALRRAADQAVRGVARVAAGSPTVR